MTRLRVAEETAVAMSSVADPPLAELVRRTTCIVVLTLATIVEMLAVSAFVLDPGLGEVDPSEVAAVGPIGARPVDALLVIPVVVVVVCSVAVAAVPRLLRVAHRRIGLAVSGVLVLGWSALLADATTVFFFGGEGDGCLDPSCWPLPWQTVALAAPGVLLGLTTIGVAFARRAGWWVVAGPALVWVAAVVAQRLLWPEVLLPLFSGPPP